MHTTGGVVALKRLKKARDGISQTAYREIIFGRACRHENVVRLHEVLLEREADGVVRTHLPYL